MLDSQRYPTKCITVWEKIKQKIGEGEEVRHGKKPTRAQKARIGKANLSPENWLVIHQTREGELALIHRHTKQVRIIPASIR